MKYDYAFMLMHLADVFYLKDTSEVLPYVIEGRKSDVILD